MSGCVYRLLDQKNIYGSETALLKESSPVTNLGNRCCSMPLYFVSVYKFRLICHQCCVAQVSELAPLRSLLECLKEPALRSSFPVQQLADFATQICDGMAYLEAKRLIHRDLAARNILVFAKDKVSARSPQAMMVAY